MDTHEFRAFLLKLQNLLTDNDRKNLHSLFGNDVPRSIRDDSTLGGTLNLLESLFQQEKITREDLTLLIKASEQIQCHDAVRLLKSYQENHTTQLEISDVKTLSQLMVDDRQNHIIFEENHEDKYHSVFTEAKSNSSHLSKIDTRSHSENFNIHTEESINQHFQSPDPIYSIRRTRISAGLLILTFMLISLIVTFMSLVIYQNTVISDLDHQLQNKLALIKALQVIHNQSCSVEENLTREIEETRLDISRNIYRMGKAFGGNIGVAFDDLNTKQSSCANYFKGFITDAEYHSHDWFQFIYGSENTENASILSSIHGYRRRNTSANFTLDSTERVNRIQVVVDNTSNSGDGDDVNNTSVVRAIRVFTTSGRSSPSIDSINGKLYDETFDGYYVSYVTGRVLQYLTHIQFHWFRIGNR